MGALIFVLLFPILVAIIQHLVERRYDVGRNQRVAKLQSDLDAGLRQIQAQLDFKSHVTGTQFDIEFGIYRSFWLKLMHHEDEVSEFGNILASMPERGTFTTQLRDQIIRWDNSGEDWLLHTKRNSLFCNK